MKSVYVDKFGYTSQKLLNVNARLGGLILKMPELESVINPMIHENKALISQFKKLNSTVDEMMDEEQQIEIDLMIEKFEARISTTEKIFSQVF